MNKKDILRYKKIAQTVKKMNCKFVGDFGSENQILKKFFDKNIVYKSFDFPKYDFEKRFKIKENLDCVVFSEVFEHLRNPRNFLKSISESLKKGSKLILTTPNSTFIKNRFSLLFGKTPLCFFGPSYKEALFGKSYSLLSEKEKLNLDMELHLRAYNYRDIKKILNLEGFRIIKRVKIKYKGLKGKILNILPLNFHGQHFIIAELYKK